MKEFDVADLKNAKAGVAKELGALAAAGWAAAAYFRWDSWWIAIGTGALVYFVCQSNYRPARDPK